MMKIVSKRNETMQATICLMSIKDEHLVPKKTNDEKNRDKDKSGSENKK